ncbi:MAG: lamin tail domain-containing protein [Anaerolineae bacterium]
MAWLRTLGLGLVLSIGLGLAPRGLSARTVRSAQGSIVINEVQANPVASGAESDFEWVELFNPGPEGVALGGWRLSDARAMTTLPEVDIPSGGYVVVAGPRFAERFPNAPGGRVTVPRIGNGLGNSGDGLQLADAAGQVVDALSWGDNTSAFDPPIPAAPGGDSLERVPAGRDTNVAGDWIVQATPSPGAPASSSSPRATATAAAPTVAAPAAVRLNEVLPAPRGVDWDGDGTANGDDEWVEVFNGGPVDLDLRGWLLDDAADGGSSAYRIPDAAAGRPRPAAPCSSRRPGCRSTTEGTAFGCSDPPATSMPLEYGATGPRRCLGSEPDGSGAWTDRLNPSPARRTGRPASARRPPRPCREKYYLDRHAGQRHRGGYRWRPPRRPARRPARRLPSPAPGIPPAPDRALFLPFPHQRGDVRPQCRRQRRRERVDRATPRDIRCQPAGWAVGDRGAWDALPDVVVPPGGFAVVAGPDELARLASGHAGPVIRVEDGRIGGGLGNDGDVVRLRDPDERLIDAVSYGANLDAFDPSVPIGVVGTSIERLPPDRDTDRASDWRSQPDLSPGRAGDRHDGTAAGGAQRGPAGASRGRLGRRRHDGPHGRVGRAVQRRLVSGAVEGLAPGRRRRRPPRLGLPLRRRSRRDRGTRLSRALPQRFRPRLRQRRGRAPPRAAGMARMPTAFAGRRRQGTIAPGGRVEDGVGSWSDGLAVTPGRPNRRCRPAKSTPVTPLTLGPAERRVLGGPIGAARAGGSGNATRRPRRRSRRRWPSCGRCGAARRSPSMAV